MLFALDFSKQEISGKMKFCVVELICFMLFKLQAATERSLSKIMADKRHVTLSTVTPIGLANSLPTTRHMSEVILDHPTANQSAKWPQIQRST